ncbi:Glycosyltransferase involved in cell wall bisynthesis [Algoriphagus faecimaris]|uniref:Glycosyltransferase involved in cell wall bisynthesis n=1 Tax=Algoriphagus faecimaris TaxID=686796 RepID=A0A1G6PTH5_9BACT|nr:glycosyltransferase [Algoriphagus faecimaris]SDC82675.1 Glycosyltransferase involved in cell wall bisynthesis [Algoriphagus faecimaris]
MKVLRIVSEMDFGGVEQVGLNSLPALNNEVFLHILVLKRGGRASQRLKEIGISLKILGINSKIPNFKLIYLIWKEIQYFQPDVVHCQGAEANFHGIIGSYIAKVPIRIAEEIGIPNHHSYWKYLFREVYRKATKVICVAERVKIKLLELKEVPKSKITVIYNPISKNLVVEKSKNKIKELRMVTVSRLVTIKNLSSVISCFSKLSYNNNLLKLWILGEGPEKESLEKKTHDLGLNENIIFWGFQSNPMNFMKEADIFLLPSYSEGSPVALAEAMAVGLPSIVTKVGGAAEILGNSESGILIDPLNLAEIQFAMQQLIDLSPEERQAMGERAKKEAQRFSVENYIQRLMEIYIGA